LGQAIGWHLDELYEVRAGLSAEEEGNNREGAKSAKKGREEDFY
jgi:hypothetical protein